jgi:hypothetical protein
MSNRPTLTMVDDPVARTDPTPAPAAAAEPRDDRLTANPDSRPTAAARERPAAEPPAAARDVPRYSDEPKKAVFGRVPRSLTRRLERALVELREHSEDLTQEQLLAALLHKHVDPSNPDSLTELTRTVEDYRKQL